MKRYLATLAVLGLLALPVMVGAEETWIPPEANWTSTPPARGPSMQPGQRRYW